VSCDKCNSAEITYYRQLRKDGVWVVTARCENGHHPITGKPFYPISQFDLKSLPVLGSQTEIQPQLFDIEPAEFDPIAQRRELNRRVWESLHGHN